MNAQEFFLIKFFFIKKALDVYTLRALQGFISVYDLNQSGLFKCFPISLFVSGITRNYNGTLVCMSTGFYDPCCQMCLSYVGVSYIYVCAHVKVEVLGEGNIIRMHKPEFNFCVLSMDSFSLMPMGAVYQEDNILTA